MRLERLVPDEIRAALKRRSLVFITLGTVEWHGAHLPVGLDALTAHGLCLRAAEAAGGLVLPPLFFGTGGGHGAYPWTIMVPPDQIEPLIMASLARLQDFGVQKAVLFSGHFAETQITMIERVASRWNAGGGPLAVLALAVNQCTDCGFAPDHAALFETTLLAALHPDLVKLHLLPPVSTAPALDPDDNPMGPQRHDPGHPLYGIFGPDPRTFRMSQAEPLLGAMVNWLLREVRES
ncbi:creatininase family protein [Rhodobacteraceae bacterium CYK-10]|uniref:Creatininase family protein n=1 Tax=Stagnihabitans tardus TaxID=2699202 RepID=A0AAE4YDR9_9RHOB|nr:creatininase family protein [Stagnihabitans tardus]